MKDDYEIDEQKQAAADVMFNYSKFVAACIGNRVCPCDLRLHLMKEISGLPTTLKQKSFPVAASPDAMVNHQARVLLDLIKHIAFELADKWVYALRTVSGT